MTRAKSYTLLLLLSFFLIHCSHTRTSVEFHKPVQQDLVSENYAGAVKKIDKARVNGDYVEKDRVIYYLDKGVVLYYQGLLKRVISTLKKPTGQWKSSLLKAFQVQLLLLF